MLAIPPSSGCREFQQATLTRRHLLQVGGIGLLGLHLPGLLRATEQSATRKPRAKAVILLHQYDDGFGSRLSGGTLLGRAQQAR